MDTVGKPHVGGTDVSQCPFWVWGTGHNLRVDLQNMPGREIYLGWNRDCVAVGKPATR
jgi:hypothetical protein